jgi:acetyl esterase/lipase
MGSLQQKLAFLIVCLGIASFLFYQLQVSNSNQASLTIEAAEIYQLWESNIPGGKLEVGAEKDMSRATDQSIAGRRVIRLGNVAQPELHVFLPPAGTGNGSSVLVCPGGGFSILAWDLEGTEVAAWLNSIGVAACVLKYRVPTRNEETPWLIPLQDTQRAISTMRHHSEKWNIDKDRVGVLGFSAGAVGALRSGTMERAYVASDEIDAESSRPDFAVLVYAGGIANEDESDIRSDLNIDAKAPPVFMVHTFDDFVPIENCLLLVKAYKKVEVPIEFHLYDNGGHGFGIRPIEEVPATHWTDRCEVWLERNGWLNPTEAPGG